MIAAVISLAVRVSGVVSPDVSRVSADEDGAAQTQHIHHALPAVDHCH